MEIIEDELSKIFDPEKLVNYVKVKKIITNEGVKIVVLEDKDIEKCIPILVEIEDLRYTVYNYPEIMNTSGYTLTISDTSVCDFNTNYLCDCYENN